VPLRKVGQVRRRQQCADADHDQGPTGPQRRLGDIQKMGRGHAFDDDIGGLGQSIQRHHRNRRRELRHRALGACRITCRDGGKRQTWDALVQVRGNLLTDGAEASDCNPQIARLSVRDNGLAGQIAEWHFARFAD